MRRVPLPPGSTLNRFFLLSTAYPISSSSFPLGTLRDLLSFLARSLLISSRVSEISCVGPRPTSHAEPVFHLPPGGVFLLDRLPFVSSPGPSSGDPVIYVFLSSYENERRFFFSSFTSAAGDLPLLCSCGSIWIAFFNHSPPASFSVPVFSQS